MIKKSYLIISFFILKITLQAVAQDKLFKLLPADSTGVDFVNIINDTKVLNVISYEYYYNGGGVAVGDVNNDGLTDIYFTSNVGDCKLYLNQGNLKFKDVTNVAGVNGNGGYKTGVVMVDINNDGWMDIYLCKSVAKEPSQRKNILYINNKNGTFTDKATEYGIDCEGISTQAAFNDMDGDGDLDLVVLNHPYNLDFAKTIHLTYDKNKKLVAVKDSITPFESNYYYENVNGHFIDKTKTSGIASHAFGLSLILQDFNNDGLTDIYQANDYLQPDYLFINKGNNKFVNEFDKYFKHCSYSSMGSDYADINNDGYSDLITVDMLPIGNQRQKQLRRGNNYDEFEKVVKYGFGYQYVKNVVQLNNGNNTYSDISYYTGMAFSDWSWGVLINDFDNDGLKDVYIANGYMRDITDMDYSKYYMDSIKKEMIKTKTDGDVVKLLSLIPSVKVQKSYFKNYGNLNFKRESKESGLEQLAWSFGAAYADLDNDGDLEIIVNNTNDNAFIYKNNTIENGLGNYISIKLNGSEKNRNGIGTKIECVTADGLKTTTVFNPMKGYLSCNDEKTIIGTGKNQTANLTITWPDGKQQLLNNVASGKLYSINYSDAVKNNSISISDSKWFEDITAKSKINYQQTENEYIDFKLEPLLPQRFSQLGPCIAVGDMNGDKRDDFFVAGAKDKSAALFFQNADGTFTLSKQPAFEKDKMYEDGAATLIDIDNDGDNDLIVTCGGNDYPNNDSKYPVRSYINDGLGNFKSGTANNNFFTSANCIAVNDFDKDGSSEIFVGGRVVPGHYGLTPKSYLFKHNKDSLIDITDNIKLSTIGMVTSAIWCDVNNDGWSDLVLAGEWMPITIFLNHSGKLDNEPTTIDSSNGWWNCIINVDVDNDGDQDIIGGNLGMNTRYRGTTDKPVSMVVSDFDKNGSTDCMISVYIKDKSYPIAIRDYVLDQMPYLRKKYLRYKTYSTATVEDIFTPEQLSAATKFTANNMSSTIFINDGKGNFSQKQLPPEAQLFPVTGIQVTDVNNDHIPDLLLCGNNYATEVETGRNDAGIGLVLQGTTNNEFNAIPVNQSGFFVPGNSKCMQQIMINNKPALLIGKNMDYLQVLEKK